MIPGTHLPGVRPSSAVVPADVWAALRDDTVRLVAQPVLSLEEGTIAGYELLARFPGPPAAPPDVWFAAARSAGLAARLTCAVIRRMHALRPTLPTNTFCSVNVEPDMLLEPMVIDALRAAGSLRRVVIELTEHVSIEQRQPLVLAALDELRALGATIAVDDAGTGYAGLSQLLQIRPDIVKLDRDLVAGVDRDPVRRSLVVLLGALANQMDAWLLAEGVETADELATLTRLQVPLAQGFHLARPADPWATLDPAVSVHLRAVWESNEATLDVMGLVRSCRTRMAGHPDLEPNDVVVDELNRPLSIVVSQPAAPAAPVPAMTVSPSSEPHDVLERAMGRATHLRFAPLVCTDPQGALVGIIDVAELVETVIELQNRSPSSDTEGNP